jgi:hypothetical protein
MKASVIISVLKHPYKWAYDGPRRIEFRNNENKLVGKYFARISVAHACFGESKAVAIFKTKTQDTIDDVGRAIYFIRLKKGLE